MTDNPALDIVSAAVARMREGDDPVLTGRFSRGCPGERAERALIEVWTAFTQHVLDIHTSRMTAARNESDKAWKAAAEANRRAADAERERGELERSLREQQKVQFGVALNGFSDRAAAKLPSDEIQRLRSETIGG